jgi:hypothetical protein
MIFIVFTATARLKILNFFLLVSKIENINENTNGNSDNHSNNNNSNQNPERNERTPPKKKRKPLNIPKYLVFYE